MCVAVPGKIVKIDKMSAEADFGGVRRTVFLDLVPSVKLNDYVLVHAGFAIQILDPEDAVRTLEIFREIDDNEKK